VVYCSSYFSTTATEEILDQIRPKLSPLDNSVFDDALHILNMFLPITMPPHLHSQGFKFVYSHLIFLYLHQVLIVDYGYQNCSVFGRVSTTQRDSTIQYGNG